MEKEDVINLPKPVVGVSNCDSPVESQLFCFMKPCQPPKDFTGRGEAEKCPFS